jgi:hypothetical protein
MSALELDLATPQIRRNQGRIATMPDVHGNEEKLAELILHISDRCANDPTFGATKLNKILCFSDFIYYAYHDQGITGVEYQKLPAGPAPRRLLPVRNKLIKEKALALQEVSLKSGRIQKRTVNLRKARLELFSGAEIALVDNIIDSLREVDAESTSRMSHEMVGWLVARDGDTIPYDTVYFANPPLTVADRYRAQELKAAKKKTGHEKKTGQPIEATA